MAGQRNDLRYKLTGCVVQNLSDLKDLRSLNICMSNYDKSNSESWLDFKTISAHSGKQANDDFPKIIN